MDPFTIMALLKGTEAVGKGVSGYMDANAMFGKSDAERMRELSRREELGTLGFTDQERQTMMREMLNPIQARERERALETRSIIGAGGDAGTAALSAMIQGDKAEAARAGAAETYLQQQAAERKKQEQELRDLEKLQEKETAAKQKAVFDAIFGGAMGVAESAQRKALYEEMYKGQAAADSKGASATPLSDTQLEEAMALMGFVPGGQ